MSSLRLALVDRSAEHKQRRAALYLLAFLALCFALHLQASVDGYLDVSNRALFFCLAAAAALCAAMAVHLRVEVAHAEALAGLIGLPQARPSELSLAARRRHPDWAIHLTWPYIVREAKLRKLVTRELLPARADERPVGLMMLAVDPALGDFRETEQVLGAVAQDLGFYVQSGTLTFRIGRNRLAVLTARLNALDELQQLADALEAEMSYRSETRHRPYKLALGIAVSMESRLHPKGLLEKAKGALGEAQALGLTSQVSVAD